MRAPSSKPQKTSQSKKLWISLAAVILTLPIVILGVTVALFQIFELNLPGVVIFDKNVGMMTRANTITWVDAAWNQNRQIQLINFENPDNTYSLSPQEVGFWIDPVATADAAFQIGRGPKPLTELANLLNDPSTMVLPVMYFDAEQAKNTLNSIAADLTVPPVNATIAYQDSSWVAVPGIDGQTVDVDATLGELFENAFPILLSGTTNFYMKSVAPEISDASFVLDEINNVISADLRMEAYDPLTDETLTWSVPDEVKRSWVSVDPKTFDVSMQYDEEKIASFLSTWQQDLGTERYLEVPPKLDEIINAWQNGRTIETFILHNPTTYTVRAGDSLWSISLDLEMPMWYIMDANDGLTTNTLESGMVLTIPSKNVLLPLPVVRDKRIVVDISEQRMYVVENGDLKDTHIISTGVADSPTMTGIFQVQTHEINAYASNWDLYMPHFMGIYEAWPDFMNGIHGLPLLSSGQRLWAGSLGAPISYGCIILDLDAAENLYEWAENGVVVEIID